MTSLQILEKPFYLCFSHINGEMIHSTYKKNFYQLLTKTKYSVENKRYNLIGLVTMYTRRTECCQKYKCQYIELRGCLGNIPVMIYLIKYGRRQTWNIMLSMNLLMNLVRVFELHQIQWNIEVVNKGTKEHLGLGSHMGYDFNGQIANATPCYLTNTVMALEKRLAEYQITGEYFSDMEVDLMALMLWKRAFACIEHILRVLGETPGMMSQHLIAIICDSDKEMSKILVMAEALEEWNEVCG